MASGSSIKKELQRLGAGRIESILVAHLLDQASTTTASIIATTGLRQPEVSVGVRSLRERNWLVAEPIPREGKGRPMHRYSLQIEPKAILDHYLKIGQQKISDIEGAIAALKKSLAKLH